MRAIGAAILAIAMAGCATTPQTPAMRPLTAEYIETIGPTQVVVAENNNGVEKAWFYTSTASVGAAYGLIGALVSVAMDAIINAGPSRRATKAANEMAELISVDALNQSLAEQLQQQIPGATPMVVEAPAPVEAAVLAEATPSETLLVAETPASAETAAPTETLLVAETPTPGETLIVAETSPPPPPSGVWFSDVDVAQRLAAKQILDDTVEIAARYTLSEDASTLRIIAVASYQNALTPYRTPYDFGDSTIPRTEREGPAYRNTFTYYSSQLPVPTLTPELRQRLVESIENSARDVNGVLPASDTDEYRAMDRERENARDNNLTKDEIAIFLTREWLRDNGAMLRREIEQAHIFFARYVLLDLNRTAIPSLTGQDELLETLADDRTVRRIGAGTDAGAYVSSAGNVTSFSTYGNVISIADVHEDRAKALRDAARER